jgi:hypothetical protein
MPDTLTRGLTCRPPSAEIRWEAARGRAFAAAWRDRQHPILDAIYGPDRPPAGALLGQREEADRGRRLAARWRADRPHAALLDRLYGKEHRPEPVEGIPS